jgi:hypothetical protein
MSQLNDDQEVACMDVGRSMISRVSLVRPPLDRPPKALCQVWLLASGGATTRGRVCKGCFLAQGAPRGGRGDFALILTTAAFAVILINFLLSCVSLRRHTHNYVILPLRENR